jgi:hypothetical protein
MGNEKLNNLICSWLELNAKKLDAIENQYYEKAAYARDDERTIERMIVDECDIVNSTSDVKSYVKHYLVDKHGINYDELDINNVKQSIRQIKLEQLNIK